MQTMTTDEVKQIEKIAEQNNGHCDRCHQTIKIYRYSVNKAAATFMRAMADEVRNTNANDVNISTIGLPYSVRTQVAKIRQHGLIARVKDERGVQLPSRWLITHKGWDFINGKPIPKRVVVFNNQVLGHDEGLVTIHGITGETFDPGAATYEETPVSQAEARTYENVRQPVRHMELVAEYCGRDANLRSSSGRAIYNIKIERLVVGRPVKMVDPIKYEYKDIAAFQRDWKIK